MMARTGRPKSENPRNMTINETRVTKEEYRMIALKSALYAGGSTAKLIRLSTEAYQGRIREKQTCGACGNIMTLKNDQEAFWFETIHGEHEIVVSGVPQYRCKCGNVEGDLIVSAAIEESLGDVVESCLKKGNPIPKQLELQSLLKPKSLVIV